jgi:hypothetical protein
VYKSKQLPLIRQIFQMVLEQLLLGDSELPGNLLISENLVKVLERRYWAHRKDLIPRIRQ